MPIKVALLHNYVQVDHLGSNVKKLQQGLGPGPGIISILPISLISKACTHANAIKVTIRIKKVIRTNQIDNFYFCMEIV